MNTLRNLKNLKSINLSLKSYADKIKFSLISNSKKIKSVSSPILKDSHNKFFFPNKAIPNSNVQKSIKLFSTKQSVFQKDLVKNELNSHTLNEFTDSINFNYIFSPDSSNYEETDIINKTLKKLEEKSLSKSENQDNLADELDNSQLKKNMLYIAFSDIKKRFPLKNKYNLDQYENLIKSKLYRDLNCRKKLSNFVCKLESDNNDLNIKIKNFMKLYKNDELNKFINEVYGFIEALQNETKSKYSEFYYVKFIEELISLRNFFKSLLLNNEYDYYSEHLYNINNKILIRLMNELQIIIIQNLGKATSFTAEFAIINQEIILDAINKYKINNFDEEKSIHFKNDEYSSLLKSSLNETYFQKEFLVKNLINYVTISITTLTKQYGEDSIELTQYYYMLSYLHLRLQNFEKAEEYIEKCYSIYSKNKANFQEENSRVYLLKEISHIEYLYVKSNLIGVFTSNKKDSYLILKQASEQIEDLESKYYSLINQKNSNFIGENDFEKDYNFSSLKFKIFYNLALYYKQYDFVIDLQACLEKCLQINTLVLKSNKNLMAQYNNASKFLLEIYENLNKERNLYDLAKKNFGLSYYIINDKSDQEENLKFYSDKVIQNINNSYDKFNYSTLLNPKNSSFNYYKIIQENFVLSLASYFQKERNDFSFAVILDEYLEIIKNSDSLQAETYENTFHIFDSYSRYINSYPTNFKEATKSLIKLRDQLQLEEFLKEELISFEEKAKSEVDKTKETQNIEPETTKEIDEFTKEIEDKFYFYKKTDESLNEWINLGISIFYNIIINQIKSDDYEEAFANINFLINFINKLNESKSVGSIVEHPYLLINLNFLAAHYHLIKNQKIYSVKYLKAVNSLITKFDWGSNMEINAYLKEMVKLINSI